MVSPRGNTSPHIPLSYPTASYAAASVALNIGGDRWGDRWGAFQSSSIPPPSWREIL